MDILREMRRVIYKLRPCQKVFPRSGRSTEKEGEGSPQRRQGSAITEASRGMDERKVVGACVLLF